jgi:putative membrane protein
MKSKLLAFTLCLTLAVADAATKKGRKPGTSTLPPTSKMIVLPPIPQVAEKPVGELITTDIGGRDLQFFSTAIESGLIVASLGDLAKTRAEAGAIKDVGSALANTQVEENKQLVRLAALKGVTLSTEPPAEQAKAAEELDKLTGSNFDKACMDKIIAASKDSVAAYEGAVASKDGDIKSFSEQMLPISKEKLRLAEKMTGAGAKAAKALFRTGAKPAGTPPAAAPVPPTPIAPPIAPEPAVKTPVAPPAK